MNIHGHLEISPYIWPEDDIHQPVTNWRKKQVSLLESDLLLTKFCHLLIYIIFHSNICNSTGNRSWWEINRETDLQSDQVNTSIIKIYPLDYRRFFYMLWRKDHIAKSWLREYVPIDSRIPLSATKATFKYSTGTEYLVVDLPHTRDLV